MRGFSQVEVVDTAGGVTWHHRCEYCGQVAESRGDRGAERASGTVHYLVCPGCGSYGAEVVDAVPAARMPVIRLADGIGSRW